MNYFDMWRDAWNFQKKYAEIKDTDEYWQAVVDESGAISKQYNNCKFMIDLLLAVITELERQYKEMKKNAETHS